MDKQQSTKIYINTYRTFLRSKGKMAIDQIEGLYKQMCPSIHKKAHLEELDIEGFMYSYLRLPPEVHKVSKFVLGQTGDIFLRDGYKLDFWEPVSAPARRRKIFFDGEETMAVFINSVTDLDDIVGLLTAFSIEWNKMHKKLQSLNGRFDAKNIEKIKNVLGIDEENFKRLERIFGENMAQKLITISKIKVDFSIKLLRGNYVDYKKAAQRWFDHILNFTKQEDFVNRPIYFVSSNTHSLVNNITGFVTNIEQGLIGFLEDKKMTTLLDYWQNIQKGDHPGSKENFLWYVLKKYENENPSVKIEREKVEEKYGIENINAKHYLDINAQILSVKDIVDAPGVLKITKNTELLKSSNALILNIDYPLGSGAYMVLSTLFQNLSQLKGVYILGKASFLHANIGDIGIPVKVYDTYTDNTFIIKNAFSQADFTEFQSGSVLSGQGVVSTKGTFLHPESVIESYFMKGYSLVEMEDGPYLSAIYEATNFSRYPEREIIELLDIPFDLGIIHYASDTPFTKAITLGTRNLGYEGVEATYLSSLAILKRIIALNCDKVE